MKNRLPFLLAFLLIPACAPAQSAGTHTVALTVVYKGDTYSFSQAAEEGRQSSFSGQVSNAGGTARALIFNSTLTGEGNGTFRLQYTLEVGAEGGNGKPPVQLQADVLMLPNRKLLAAEGGDWKVYLKIKARAVKNESRRSAKDCRITANAVLAGLDIPLRLVVSPGTQASYVAYLDAQEFQCSSRKGAKAQKNRCMPAFLCELCGFARDKTGL
ncbi:MAG: hypothetical protein KKH28_08715 [Elusimicrobia bacterium]|nr:hypothetical protein [Elusimicrobiota bacterium]